MFGGGGGYFCFHRADEVVVEEFAVANVFVGFGVLELGAIFGEEAIELFDIDRYFFDQGSFVSGDEEDGDAVGNVGGTG